MKVNLFERDYCMEDKRKKAYRTLLYQALLDIRVISGSLSKSEVTRKEVFHLADAFHNLADFSIYDFEDFDEEGFWSRMNFMTNTFPDSTNYKEVFENLLLEIWINIDKPTKTCTIHKSINCNYLISKQESDFKGIHEIRRDGGWLRFDNLTEAFKHYRRNYKDYNWKEHC